MMHSRIILFLFVALFVYSAFVSAHTNHKKKGQQTQTQESQTQSEQTTQSSKDAVLPDQHMEKHTPSLEEEGKLPPLKELMMEHLHNKIIHFPIAFGLAGVLFVWLTGRDPHFDNSAKILWILAAAAGIAAYFTGTQQKEPFEGTYLWPQVELHRNLGIATTISLVLGAVLLFIPTLKRLLWIWGLIVLILISLTGFYGGVIAHAE